MVKKNTFSFDPEFESHKYGFNEGYEEGQNKGYEAGYKDGWEDAKEELIRCMHLIELSNKN